MAAIKQINARITTANKGHAGTGGRVYLGLGGREFKLASLGQYDFAPGQGQTFILGEGENMGYPHNDPRSPQLDTESLNKYPMYIRFEPRVEDDLWGVDEISVTVNPGSDPISFSGLGSGSTLWLGNISTKIFYFGAD
jgi:hypothetical protein